MSYIFLGNGFILVDGRLMTQELIDDMLVYPLLLETTMTEGSDLDSLDGQEMFPTSEFEQDDPEFEDDDDDEWDEDAESDENDAGFRDDEWEEEDDED